MIKNTTSGTRPWVMIDTKRGTTNSGSDQYLKANSSDAEDVDSYLGMTSTGFQLQDTGGNVNASGEITYSNYWPANATGTDIFANVIDDPSATFEIQADAAMPVADLFGNFDIVDATAGSTVSGNSRTELDVTTGATTAGLPLKAIDISQDPENSDVATANTNVIVKINNHLFSAGTAGPA